jgi:hypothetical protein
VSEPLLTLLRQAPAPPAASRWSEPEWRQLVASAESHGLTAYVHHQLERAGLSPPGVLGERLRRHAILVTAQGLKAKRLLLRALDALSQVEILPALLKGYGLASRLYPEPLLRPTSDVDLLVTREELDRAAAALTALGLTRHDDPGADPLESHHHLAFGGPAGTVELHFRATSGLGTPGGRDALSPLLISGELDGLPVRYLAPADELVYLAVHAAQHLFLRLGWLLDLKLLLLAHPQIDAREVESIARSSGMSSAIWLSLFAAQRAVGLELPPSLLQGLRPSRWKSIAGAQLFSEERLVSASLARSPSLAFAVRSAMAEGAVRMGRHAVEGVFRRSRRLLSQLRERGEPDR